MRNLRKRALFKSMGCKYVRTETGFKVSVLDIRDEKGLPWIVATWYPITMPGMLQSTTASIAKLRKTKGVE